MAAVVHELTNTPETLEHHANVLKNSEIRRNVFRLIYSGKANPKSVRTLMKSGGLTQKQVLTAGKSLADNGMVTQVIVRNGKGRSETAYEKTKFCSSNRDRIISLAKNPKNISKLVTVRRPQAKTTTLKVEKIFVPVGASKIKHITIDDIDSFELVRGLHGPESRLPKDLSETDFKDGVARIIGEKAKFKDWGGEKSDLMTSRVLFKGKRIPAAFAFKGPGTNAKLVPGKMGKNGDQCQRLFTEPADLFIVQHWREIDSSVLELAKTFAIAKSVAEMREILYCIIDGQDSRRIYDAYLNSF